MASCCCFSIWLIVLELTRRRLATRSDRLEASRGRGLCWAPWWHIIRASAHDTALSGPARLGEVIFLEAVAHARVAGPLVRLCLLG